jgi:AcrR family transcriptional regulator
VHVARTVGSNAPDTRRRILASAAEVFAEHGYSGASMRDIAERLGITKAALYYHFTSKEDLLDGLVHPVMQSMADFTREAESEGHSAARILREFLALTVAGIPAILPLMTDPGARDAIKTRYDLHGLGNDIALVLAGGTDPDRVLRSQFALAGIRSLVVSRVMKSVHTSCASDRRAAPGAGAGAALLSDTECEVLLQAALASLAVAD